MRHRLVLISLALLAGTATAQTSYRVVPAGHATQAGGTASHLFGTQPNMRIQWAEGELGNTAVRLRGIGFRTGGSILFAPARSYRNLSIECSDGDHRTMSRLFAANARSTPTRVFSSSIALPAIQPYGLLPKPWLSTLDFPFRSTYLHRGTRDLLLGVTLRGGSFQYGTWKQSAPYSLDAPAVEFTATSWQGYLGNGAFHPTNKVGCRDSTTTAPHGPYAKTGIQRTPRNYAPSPNRIRAGGYAAWVPPKTTIAFLRGAPLIRGTAIPGVTCNKLHVDLTKPWVLRFATSGSRIGYTDVFDSLTGDRWIPAQPSWGGITFATQIAFADAGNGSLRLSQAGVNQVPRAPLLSIKRSTLHAPDLVTAWGYGPYDWSHLFPVIRYAN